MNVDIDVNQVQAELCDESSYREKFLITELAWRTTQYVFFQMLNNKHPKGNSFSYNKFRLYILYKFLFTTYRDPN